MKDIRRTICSLAMLKALLESQRRDFVQTVIPLVALLILKREYATVDTHALRGDFEDEYGIRIPYHAMIGIIGRCRKQGLIVRRNAENVPNIPAVKRVAAPAAAADRARAIDEITADFQTYAANSHDLQYAATEALQCLLGFLNDHDVDILFVRNDGSPLPTVKLRRRDKYAVSMYVRHIHAESPALFKTFADVSLGHIVARMLTYTDVDRFAGRLRAVDVYLDTPMVIKLIGVEGKEKGEAFAALASLIRQHGGTLKMFRHTYEEIAGILDDCVVWVEKPDYDPRYASPAMKYFVQNNYGSSDVALFRSKLDTILSGMEIPYDIEVDPDQYREHQIGEERLFELIVDGYQASNYVYENWRKHLVVDRDVKSISNIHRLRKGKVPVSLQQSACIFLTTNAALAHANIEYEHEVYGEDYKIYCCYTDVFLGTLLWLQSPAQFEQINQKNLIAASLAGIQADQPLIELFLEEVNRLSEQGAITPEEYYFMRAHRLPLEILSRKTKNDIDLYYEKTAEEILEEIKEKVRSEEVSKTKEKEKQLSETIDELVQTATQLKTVREGVYRFSAAVGNLVSWGIFVVLFGALIASIVFSPGESTPKWIRIALKVVTVALALFGTAYGLNFQQVRLKLQRSVSGAVARRLAPPE